MVMSGWWKLPVFRKTSKSPPSSGSSNNRASSGRRGVGQGKVDQALQGDGGDKTRAAASPRQIHPLCDDKTQLLAYESKTAPPTPVEPPGYPPPPPLPTYPLAPNICVEDGRIEFIKPPPESVTLTVTRAQQTCCPEEKSDVAKESLEARVLELERALEAEQRSGQRERLAVTRLQRQLARREVLQRDVDRERRLRLDTEERLRDSTSEAERCRTRLAALQREFARMEDTVRTVLQYKARSEQLKQEKTSLTIAYETQIRCLRNKVQRLSKENEALRKKLQALERLEASGACAVLQEQLKVLEAHNRSLLMNTEMQRREYEKCLDNVAAQVVRALCAQKNLMIPDVHTPANDAPDTPLTSATSVSTPSSSDLVTPSDEQYALLRGRFNQHRILGETGTSSQASGTLVTALSGLEPVFWLPLQRPRSLNLQVHDSVAEMASLSLAANFNKCQHRRTRSINVHNGKNSAGGEDEGSESPESGNRDEGYSTMSSDVQGEAVHSGEAASSMVTSEPLRRGLEDVKEATEESDTAVVPVGSASAIVVDCGGVSPQNRLLMMEDACDPDVLYIPLGLTLGLSSSNPRHSFPPSRDLLPYQHIMRSFSDSHLCLKLTAAASSPCAGVTNCQRQHSSFSFSSTASSSPSVLLLDVLASGSGDAAHSQAHPLRRTRATTSLLTSALNERQEVVDDDDDAHSNTGSWCSGGDLVVEGCWWDADYVQHWLRLDDTRSALQQQHRDLMELEYDQAELEDWSMSLSSEDVTSSGSAQSAVVSSADSWSLLWRRPGPVVDTLTPSQQICGLLPSIQENNALELEEDSNECLWNNASYLLDRPSELSAILLDGESGDHSGANVANQRTGWPYGSNVGVGASYSLASPGGSWSSTGTNSEECCHSYDCAYNGCVDGGYENSSKRSSAAMSGCSDDAVSAESPAVGTDFTRDFYRLVKFESTKSLASTSSRSLIGGAGMSEVGGSLTRKPGSELMSTTPVMQSQDREETLQSVLNFIAEQQQYCASREKDDLAKNQSIMLCEGQHRGTNVSNCDSSSRTCFEVQPNEECISNAEGYIAEPNTETAKDKSTSTVHLCEDRELKLTSITFQNTDLQDSVESHQKLIHKLPSDDCSERVVEESVEDLVKIGDCCEEQIHTIIEVSTRDHAHLSVDENDIQNSSNKREKCTEVLLNVQNSKSQEFKQDHCIDLNTFNLKIERPFTEQVCAGNEEGISATMVSRSDEISSKVLWNCPTNSCNDTRCVNVNDGECDIKNNNSDENLALAHLIQVPHSSCIVHSRSVSYQELTAQQGRSVDVLVTVVEEDDEQPASLESSFCREMTESFTSTVSSPDTVVCPARQAQNIAESSISLQECLDDSSASVIIMDGPPHARAASFHERATSKDVIEELNRMIRKGDDGTTPLVSLSTVPEISSGEVAAVGASRLDLACCCPTGWVHVERDIDFTDPKARANLLDVMLASSGSSGNSSASSSPTNSESGDEPADYQHLHRLHRFRRQKKASATREQLGVLRYSAANPRPSIIGRDDFFVRYGEKEREAVASFDFLEEMSTTSVSGASSCDTLGSRNVQPPAQVCVGSTTPSSDDSDEKTGEQISISDSCLASDSSSPISLDTHDDLRLM
ncbi:uncharacterized protein [Anabrus simplex]|uniref:uncharacterized protein isoform X2 n=1 Tax=Anabrus simplex TaxID=316456 RepID=UPI0035A35297